MPKEKQTRVEVGNFAEFCDHIIPRVTKKYHLESGDAKLISNIMQNEGEAIVLATIKNEGSKPPLDPAAYVGLSIHYLLKWEKREKGVDPLRILQIVENPKTRAAFKSYAKMRGAKQTKLPSNPVAKYVQVLNGFFASNIFNKRYLHLAAAVLATVQTTDDIMKLATYGSNKQKSLLQFIIADCVTEALTEKDMS